MRKKLMATFCTLGTLCLAAGIGLGVQANVSAEQSTPTVTLKQGASARLHETEYGIRFTGVIDNYDAAYTYGMYIFPAEYLEGYETGSVKEYAESKCGGTLAGGDCKVYQKGNAYQINGALTGLKYNNLNREFVAIAYAKDGNGSYTYSDVSVSRNIVWVAGAALDDTAKEYDETQTNVLNNFIKLGYHQAVGTEEETAKAANALPEISVSGSTEVYNYLYAAPAPSFTSGGAALENAFNPYANEVSEGLTYTQKKVRGYQAGSYTMSYANVTGEYGVTVRAFDETLDEQYFGIYKTVTNVQSGIVFEKMDVACSADAEISLTAGGVAKGFAAGTDYTVTEDGVSISAAKLGAFAQASNLIVCDGETATVYGVEAFPNVFDPASAITYRAWIAASGIGADNQTFSDKVGLYGKSENASLEGRYYTYGIDIKWLKAAFEAGYYALEFEVRVDETFAARTATKGIRVYSSTQTNAVDVGGINNTTSGVRVYGDFGTNMNEAGTFTVTVNLKDFLAMDANAKQFRFVIANAANNTLWFSNFRVRNATAEELAGAAAAELQTKYGFTSTNSTRPKFGGKWEVASEAQIFNGINWDATEQAMKVGMYSTSAAINGRYHVIYTGIDMLKDAYNAGFTTMTFKVRSSDAFTADGRGVRVYSKQNSGLDSAGIETNANAGIYVYGDFGTAANTTEFTVTIDIAAFLALNANANYMGIVMNIPGSTYAYFSDLNFTKAE